MFTLTGFAGFTFLFGACLLPLALARFKRLVPLLLVLGLPDTALMFTLAGFAGFTFFFGAYLPSLARVLACFNRFVPLLLSLCMTLAFGDLLIAVHQASRLKVAIATVAVVAPTAVVSRGVDRSAIALGSFTGRGGRDAQGSGEQHYSNATPAACYSHNSPPLSFVAICIFEECARAQVAISDRRKCIEETGCR